MQRHVANGGNPYDHFGHYVISLSEQAYNYRRVNNLLARKSFTENSEVSEITEKSKKKIKDIKKVLERIQRQNGYLLVRENFTTFKKKEMDEETLNELRNAFTTQQFNEELVELFPYISDLIGEEVDEATDPRDSRPETYRPNNTGYAWDRLSTRSPSDPKDSKKTRAGKQSGLKHSIKGAMGKHGPKGHLPEEQEIDEISKKLALRHNQAAGDQRDRAMKGDMPRANPHSSKKRPTLQRHLDGMKMSYDKLTGNAKVPATGDLDEEYEKKKPSEEAKKKKSEKMKAYRDGEEKDRKAGYNYTEAKGDVPDDVFFADPKNAPSADWVAQDAKAKAFPTRGDSAQRQGGLLDNLEQAVQAAPFIEIEPYSKDFITKAIAITQHQVDQLTQKAQENPRDNQTKWGLEKATARLGILMKRLETAEAQGPEKNSIAIEHLGKHIKNNDVISNLMLSASDEYNRMAPAEKQRMIKIYKEIVSKQKYVGLFTNESIAYTDLEMTLSETKTRDNRFIEGLDPVVEFIKGLRKAIGEESEEEEDDDCDCQTDEEDMVKTRPDKAEKTGDPKDVVEFVKSLYNADENSFPRGEEGVVISSVKEFGDDAEPVARKVIEALKAQGAENGVANPNDDMMRMKQLAGLAPIQNF
jgi:hypothetical protein